MVLETVKEQWDETGAVTGWLVNGTMSVPNHDSNRHCRMVKEWIAEGNTPTPMFTEAEQLQNAIDKKVSEIDSATKASIIDLAGDDTKQRNNLMLGEMLLRKEAKGTATVDEIAMLDSLETLALNVASLRATGNDKEALVKAVTITTDLATALADIEVI